MNLSDLEVKMILPKLHLLSDLIIAKKYDFKTVSDKFSKLINDLNSNIIIENMTDKKWFKIAIVWFFIEECTFLNEII